MPDEVAPNQPETPNQLEAPSQLEALSQPETPSGASGARVLPKPGIGLLAPSRCACCYAVAGESLRVEPFGSFGTGPVIVAQYCSACFAHAAAGRTRWLAATSASLLLGLSAAAALVLAGGILPPLLQAAAAGIVALAPAATLLRGGPKPPHTTRGAAAWWVSARDGWALQCTHAGWAAQVAEATGSRFEPLSRRPRRWPWPVLASAVLSAAAVPLAQSSLGVTLRVVNRSAGPAVLVVDGRHQGEVPASSAESPRAGLRAQVVAGRRHLTLIGKDGQILADTVTFLRPGVDHLLAVSPEPVCFWVERSSYGSSSSTAPARELLEGEGPVWQLPGRIDSWFAPNPANDGRDAVSSGGVLLALRQGRCPNGRPQPLADRNP